MKLRVSNPEVDQTEFGINGRVGENEQFENKKAFTVNY